MPAKCWVTSATEMDRKVYVSAITSAGFAPFMYDINTEQWSPMPVLLKVYFVLVAVHSKKHLLAIGGSIGGILCDEVFLWEQEHKRWVMQYPNMPTPRCSITGICYHSTVIVAGGITHWEQWTLTRVVEVLHINDISPSDSYWSTVEQLPHGIYAAIPLLCNDTLYISSYIDLHFNTFTILTAPVPELLKSNNNNSSSSSSSNSLWSKIPDAPYSSYSMICYQGRLITFTGIHLVEEPNRSKIVHKLVPMIHIYNPDTLSWDCMGYISCKYALGRSVCIGDNKILFIGGVTGSYDHYFSTNWIQENLQLELRAVVNKLHPSIITY